MQYLSPFDGFSKTRILSRREEELRHAIRNSLGARKIERAAERVRTAKLYLFKALRHSLVHGTSREILSTSRLEELQIETDLWERRSVKSIIDEYAPTKIEPCQKTDSEAAPPQEKIGRRL